MHRSTIRRRPALALALLLALAAALPSGAAKATADGSLTIHARLCPANYDGPDFFELCHGTPLAGATFAITAVDAGTGATGTTAADGNTTLPLAEAGFPGPFRILGVAPFGSALPFVACVDGADQEVPVEFADSGVATVPDARGEGIVCDWYFSPIAGTGESDGRLTVETRLCPDEYAGNDYAADCTAVPPAGTEFLNVVAPSEPIGVEIDDQGVATLPLLDAQIPGDVQVAFSLPGNYTAAVPVIFCLDADGVPVYPDMRTERIFIPVASDGAVIACTWFLVVDEVDAGDAGFVTVYATACPTGYTGDDFYADCFASPIAGASFGIALGGSHVGVVGSTGADGFAVLPNLAESQPGVLRIDQTTNPKTDSPGYPPPAFDDAVVYCSKDDGQTAIPVAIVPTGGREIPAEPGDGIRCDWFGLPTAGGTPTPAPSATAAAVFRLPNTGAGTIGSGPGTPAAAIALSLMGALGAAIGGAAALSGRRPTPVPIPNEVRNRAR